MKSRKILIGAFTGLFIFMLFGCGSTPVPSTSTTHAGMDLDAAIREAATQMETRIPSGTMVALVSVASPSTAFSTQVLTRLESAIVSNGKLVVVDRANLDKVREEQGFQLSGEVDDESAKSIGRLLGAGAIVTGSLTDLGDVYSLTLKAINIETATVAVSYLADLAKTTRIETLLATRDGAAITSTSGTTTVRVQSTSSTTSTTPITVERTPPLVPQNLRTGTIEGTTVALSWTSAGSNVSYRVYYGTMANEADATIAGNVNGTTYTVTNLQRRTVYYFWVTTVDGALESSKSDVVSATTTNTYNIGDTGPGGGIVFAVGGSITPSGDIVFTLGGNTNWEVSQFLGNLNHTDASWTAQNYRGGGYTDWRLPSWAELKLVYENLQRSGKADLGRSNNYWSSASSQGIGYALSFRDGGQLFNHSHISSVFAVRSFN